MSLLKGGIDKDGRSIFGHSKHRQDTLSQVRIVASRTYRLHQNPLVPISTCNTQQTIEMGRLNVRLQLPTFTRLTTIKFCQRKLSWKLNRSRLPMTRLPIYCPRTKSYGIPRYCCRLCRARRCRPRSTPHQARVTHGPPRHSQ